mmetsp:Transcript_15114/g.48085  ORF Transcript_15114/g.48085 Transcript_15114/m.48085 type:complete len:204 (-) Transcript_15114:328-939(-)
MHASRTILCHPSHLRVQQGKLHGKAAACHSYCAAASVDVSSATHGCDSLTCLPFTCNWARRVVSAWLRTCLLRAISPDSSSARPRRACTAAISRLLSEPVRASISSRAVSRWPTAPVHLLKLAAWAALATSRCARVAGASTALLAYKICSARQMCSSPRSAWPVSQSATPRRINVGGKLGCDSVRKSRPLTSSDSWYRRIASC